MRKQNNRFRRGIAIEMAVGMMLIMIALSIILLTVSRLQSGHRREDLADLNERIEIYRILDTICDGATAPVDNETIHVDGKDYTIKKTDDLYEIKDGEKTVVTVEITVDNKIASWK